MREFIIIVVFVLWTLLTVTTAFWILLNFPLGYTPFFFGLMLLWMAGSYKIADFY